ncbi:unnamed protein product [Calicophoron daubneyi]|uniref:Saposin B-type domain-containing protein n=1 Tax=Calicophoron daubneyi TaxID=300641 RepID=A0AAV2TSQ9_CALDB
MRSLLVILPLILAVCSVPAVKGGEDDELICEICKEVIPYVKKVIDMGLSKELVLKTVDRLCDLAEDKAAECKMMGEHFIGIIWDQIMTKKPEEVCKGGEDDELICEICKEVIPYVKKVIDMGLSKELVLKTVDRLCDLAEDKAAECKMMGEHFIGIIWDQIMTKKPEEVCKGGEDDELICEICKGVIPYVKKMIYMGLSKATVLKVLDIMCDFMENKAAECRTMGEIFINMAWDAIKTQAPEELCKVKSNDSVS